MSDHDHERLREDSSTQARGRSDPERFSVEDPENVAVGSKATLSATELSDEELEKVAGGGPDDTANMGGCSEPTATFPPPP